MTKSFWTCALMTLLSAGISAGFSLVALFGPGRGDGFAPYAASRSVALLLTVVIAICVRSRMAIAVLGIAMTVVQAFDGIIGVLGHDPAKTYGPFAFGVLNALVVIWLLRGKAVMQVAYDELSAAPPALNRDLVQISRTSEDDLPSSKSWHA